MIDNVKLIQNALWLVNASFGVLPKINTIIKVMIRGESSQSKKSVLHCVGPLDYNLSISNIEIITDILFMRLSLTLKLSLTKYAICYVDQIKGLALCSQLRLTFPLHRSLTSSASCAPVKARMSPNFVRLSKPDIVRSRFASFWKWLDFKNYSFGTLSHHL